MDAEQFENIAVGLLYMNVSGSGGSNLCAGIGQKNKETGQSQGRRSFPSNVVTNF
jgi:hypothetical protein